ncbi:MAG: 3-deoxy-D-manno-octulosonate 8-phosphate phosphatase [Candidatus Cloacimonadota bacterium]|nr:MAG: 3-deoxy-D-manno-octulosonate 8-phosphate phosphatase [Candidatus Cloacimonadota bacterium]
MVIKAILSDVDGVMNDGVIFIDSNGDESIKSFHVKDGMGIKTLQQQKIFFGVISGRSCKALVARMNQLGVFDLYLGKRHKLESFEHFLQKYNLKASEVAYIGDDLNDLILMDVVNKAGGLSACPNDAVTKVKEMAQLSLETNGGHGVLRELIDLILDKIKVKDAIQE